MDPQSDKNWKKNDLLSETEAKSTGVTLKSSATGSKNYDHLTNLTLEEKEARLGELWKVFGMNTAGGKSLY